MHRFFHYGKSFIDLSIPLVVLFWFSKQWHVSSLEYMLSFTLFTYYQCKTENLNKSVKYYSEVLIYEHLSWFIPLII